ncbi:hypothetical protein [Nostocoides sp. Soil756]|uniref:SCO6745 family protein n=1 Tax=Nostocoides sp. Soil756 TaxID=1736399 RepID=UPI0006FEF02B|nr:hypothetical protein [Tetrasphaera sp. Soil756]KRE62724.1 hypothetical protein ASG78_06960 [Tetrasphaera sp. Soil756]
MTTTSPHDESARTAAALAHRTLEPYHLVSYFGPHVDGVRDELGIGWLGSYTGMRAGPLGEVPGAVVAAAFFGFRPAAVEKAWGLARQGRSPGDLDALRTRCVDAGLREALGDAVSSPELARVADGLRSVLAGADHGGRVLGAAYAALPWPDEPHLALWHAATVWREWRGDGHNAALVAAGLRPLEALVLYDAWVRATSPAGAGARGRPFLQPSRKWTDEEWDAATAALTDAGLLAASPAGDGAAPTISAEGRQLRDGIESTTDAASAAVWVGVEDAAGLLTAARPFVKAVIDTGWLPGTRPKG